MAKFMGFKNQNTNDFSVLKANQPKEILSEKLVMDDLSENGHRVRRNLIIFSTIVIFCSFSGVDIVSNEMDFYGLKIHISSPIYIIWLALAIVSYQLLHFIFINAGHLQYLKIRTTKANKQKSPKLQVNSMLGEDPEPLHINTDSNGNAVEYDEKQSNLYEWWTRKINAGVYNSFSETNKIISGEIAKSLVLEIESLDNLKTQRLEIEKIIAGKGYLSLSDLDSNDEKEFKTKIVKVYEEVHRDIVKIRENNQTITNSFDAIKKGFDKTNELLGKIEKIVGNKTIRESLENFNQSYKCYKATEILRFAIIEFIIPVWLGFCSIGALLIILNIYEI